MIDGARVAEIVKDIITREVTPMYQKATAQYEESSKLLLEVKVLREQAQEELLAVRALGGLVSALKALAEVGSEL